MTESFDEGEPPSEESRPTGERRRSVQITPELQRALAAIATSGLSQLQVQIGKQFTDWYAKQLADVTRIATSIVLPPLRLDYQSLFPDLASLSTQLGRQYMPVLTAFREFQRAQFAETFTQLAKLAEALWPLNWKGIKAPDESTLEAILLDEGLCVAWVPPGPILARLFSASTAGDRRRVIGTGWKHIALEARDQLNDVTAESLKHHVSFARRAIEAVLDGNPPAGQALATNLLDTVLRRQFSSADRMTITKQNTRFDLDEHPVRLALVLGGIWGAHSEYWPDRGDKIPIRFSRHATTHGVSRRQYTRVNATISLMHITALLRVLQQYER